MHNVPVLETDLHMVQQLLIILQVENLKQSNNELRGNLKVLTERVTELESCNKSLTSEVINCLR